MIKVGDVVIPLTRPAEERWIGNLAGKSGIVIAVNGPFVNVNFENIGKKYNFLEFELKKVGLEYNFRNPKYNKEII